MIGSKIGRTRKVLWLLPVFAIRYGLPGSASAEEWLGLLDGGEVRNCSPVRCFGDAGDDDPRVDETSPGRSGGPAGIPERFRD